MKNKKTWAALSALLIAIIGGAVWAMQNREDPEVTKAKEASKEIMAKFADENVSAADRVKAIQESRKVTENLSDEQRQEVRREGWQSMRGQMLVKIDDYLAIEDEGERNAFLDAEIDRWDEMRKEFGKMREQRKKEEGESGEAKGDKDRGGRGGWGRPQAGDKEGMEDRSRRRLDSSSPEQRAKFTEYFTAIMKRREERGMSNDWGRGR